MRRSGYDDNYSYYNPPPPPPTTTPRYPDLPKFYLLNKFMTKEPAPSPARSDHQTPPPQAADHQPLHHDHHSNKKKVQFMSEKKPEVIDGQPIRKDHSTIDEAADGYIQQKHKKFELAKWMTFNNTTT